MARDYVHSWPQQLRQQEKRGDRLSGMEALDVRLRLAWSGSCVCAAISVVVQVRNVFRTQAFNMAWKGGYLLRADPGILAALFVIGLSASLPAGVLYWLMRPTILPNPGMSAYRPPRPDPLFPLIARETRDPYALSIAAAKQENGLLRADARSALAAAQDAEPTAGGLASTTLRPQRRQRSARTQSRQQNPSVSAHEPAAPFNTWANRDRSFASWYR
jgi:hypothetical protein